MSSSPQKLAPEPALERSEGSTEAGWGNGHNRVAQRLHPQLNRHNPRHRRLMAIKSSRRAEIPLPQRERPLGRSYAGRGQGGGSSHNCVAQRLLP